MTRAQRWRSGDDTQAGPEPERLQKMLAAAPSLTNGSRALRSTVEQTTTCAWLPPFIQ